MSVEVVMPQMGESITEGTVSKWLKKVGDRIEKDEPILEISTDKVDAEVPSPGPGILLEIRTQEGETVEVGTVVAVVGDEGESKVSSQEPAGGGRESAVNTQQLQTDGDNGRPEAGLPAEPTAIGGPVLEPEIQQPSSQNSKSEEVVMPQMGESITEGTVSKWLKAVGDDIAKDEPLLEVSTDKVDAEVPSPAAGKLLAINVQEGETVEVGAVLALVGAPGSAQPGNSAKEPPTTLADAGNGSMANAAPPAPVPPTLPTRPAATNGGPNGNKTVDDLRRTKSSPLVRNIAKEHGIDITRIPGTGINGRVTRSDIMSFIETGAALRPQDLISKSAMPSAVQSPSPTAKPKVEYAAPRVTASAGDRIEKMSLMRTKIAEHMTFSKQTSAHVTSVYEIDMTNVAKFRTSNQAAFQDRFGTKLTFMPFIFQAVAASIREHRIVNSQVDGDQIVYKGDINLGMAVALDWGLIVPVLRNADLLTLAQLATTANDLADRARTKRLKPDEVQGGTFTITNPGVFGGLFGTPIINQPQVAILCVGTIEKRAKVLTSPDGDDYVAVRQMAYFALTYDHRVVDGADAEKFLAFMKGYLEAAPFTIDE
ncbi:MAG: 2-oxoglutarate dehydrogenase, E2 component, dihydrolipoamide succinyltransferase [Pyrinomonadaceae bacterium]